MDLSFLTFGSGPAAVLLHGLLGSGDNLTTVAKWIESRFTVYLPDLPNHGSSPHADRAGYDVMVSELESFIRRHAEAPVVIVGHSMGGKVAMRLALSHPELTRLLVVLDIAPRRYQPSHSEILAAMEGLDLSTLKSRSDADRRLAPTIPDRQVRSFLLKNLVRTGNRYRWRLNLDAIRRDYDEILGWAGEGVYPGPAIFVGGGRSSYLQADRDREIVTRHFPNASIRMIPEAGHWVHVDAPEALRCVLLEYLDQYAPGSARSDAP